MNNTKNLPNNIPSHKIKNRNNRSNKKKTKAKRKEGNPEIGLWGGKEGKRDDKQN